jgi:arylsulfatase A-like enzyme
MLEETGREVLVLYTSDHGQSFDPAARSWTLPHAVVDDPPMVQAAVPLLLLTVGEPLGEQIRTRYDPRLVDGVSGFEIFPTLLQAAGYTRSDVPELHTSLFEPDGPRPERAFLSGNLFSQEGGFYIYNPTLGDAGFRNAFSSEGVSRPVP